MKTILLISLCLCAGIDVKAQASVQTIPFAANLSRTNGLGAARRGGTFPANAARKTNRVANDFISSPAPGRAGGAGSFVALSITERGPHHKVVQSATAQTNLDGQVSYRTNSYTELATGMHYQENGEWKETRELIEPFERGAVARYGPHKVVFANNLNTAGAIDMETPDGKRLRSHVLGLAYFDTTSGQSVLIAEVKDCQGQIVASNQVLYADAFTGIKADVQYTYTKAGFEQDIILRTQPPLPKDYGLNPETARLQVFSEFLNPPIPAKVEQTFTTSRGETVPDELLDFGEFKMTAGRAFLAGQKDSGHAANVAKRWFRIDDRDLLFEEVPVTEVTKDLEALPKGASLNKPQPAGHTAKLEAQLPGPRKAAANRGGKMLLAKLDTPRSGLVLDYVILASSAENVLKGDTTYFVSGYVGMSGTTTFEGGAVIKYAPNASLNVTPSNIPGQAIFNTSNYRPVIFTAQDDDSIGEPLWGISTGHPSGSFYGNPALYVVGLLSQYIGITNVHFRYARCGVGLAGNAADIRSAQFVNCETGVRLAGTTATIRNALFAHVKTNFLSLGGGIVNGQQVTIDDSLAVIKSSTSPSGSSVRLYSSIFANVTALNSGYTPVEGIFNGFFNSPQFGSSQFTTASNPFQISGGGAHYLASSNFRGKGWVGIEAQLKAELKAKTTQPPIAFPRIMRISGELTLFPQVPRYVSGPPDLGYHYDALDYTMAAMFVDGGTMTVVPGTAVGFRQELTPELSWPWDYTQFGINLLKGASLVSQGTPNQPNVFTDVQLVQEGSLGPVLALFLVDEHTAFSPDDPGKGQPSLDFRFSNFYTSSGWYQFLAGDSTTWSPAVNLSLRDCNMYGGWIWLGKDTYYDLQSGSIRWVNNLFDRVKFHLDPNWLDFGDPTLYVDLGLEVRNNLFRGGVLALGPIPATSGNWVFKDNLFDQAEFVQITSQAIDHDYNAYRLLLPAELQWGGESRLSPAGNSDQVLAGAPAYQTGPLGAYYWATSSPLYQTTKRGSRPVAGAGLYHYTTRTDHTKDGAQTGNVIIGRHYVATASSSSTLPKDADADGIPDFVEDANGNNDPADVLAGVETDPALAQTQTSPPTADSVNTIYDDIDLDGDGMVGRIEKALNMDPLAFGNPLALAKVTAGNEPDIATFEVAVSSSTLTAAGGLNLNVDGVDARLATANYPVGQNAHLAWNTTYNAPSPHLIQARLSLKGALPTKGVRMAAGPLTFFNSPNLVQFFRKGSPFNDSIAYLDARIPAGTRATYVINLYDPSTTPRTLIDSISSTAPVESVIRESWSVTYPPDHVTKFTGNRVQAEFNVTLTDATTGEPAGSGTSTKEIYRLVNSEIGKKISFAYTSVAIQSTWDTESRPEGTIWRGMQNVVDTLTMPNTTYEVYNSDFNHFWDWDYPNWGYPGYVSDMFTTDEILIPTLQDPGTRQFYCNAHASPTELSDSWDNAIIDCRNLMFKLGNFIEPSAKIDVVSNPYRFVFLDGCATASTRSWANAFGIFGYGDELEGRSIVGPQAFVGYEGDKINWTCGPDPTWTTDPYLCKKIAEAYCATLDMFYVGWMLGEMSLYECIKQAETTENPYCFAPFPTPNRKNWRIKCVGGLKIGFYSSLPFTPDPTVDIWIQAFNRPSQIYVIGHQGLTRDGCKEDQDTASIGGYMFPDPGN